MVNFSPAQRLISPLSPYETSIKLEPGASIRLDFGFKRAGLLHFYTQTMPLDLLKSVKYVYSSDLGMMDSLWRCFEDETWLTGRFPAHVRCQPYGTLDGLISKNPTEHDYILEETLSVLRYLELRNMSADQTIEFNAIRLEYTAAPFQYIGGFECSDPLVNQCWAMGAYTVELCSQPSIYTQKPLAGRFSDYVIWDGVRRDKDIWGGDLRPASLTALYAFDKPEIVKNTLDILLELQHKDGPEEGIIPGSGSYGQLFYEWTMWSLVNLWEYVLFTGDMVYLRDCKLRLDRVIAWMERRSEADGLIHGKISWMYSIDARGKMSGLALAQKAAWDALASIYQALGEQQTYLKCTHKANHLKQVITASFSNSVSPLLTMLPAGSKARDHYSIDGNLWAILHHVVERERAKEMLNEIESHFWTERGSMNVYPVFDETDGDWWSPDMPKESAVWRHNHNIWPYMGAYEVLARLSSGDIDKGLELMKRIGNSHIQQGHHTYWEMMYRDGSLPYGNNGDILSLCHAWGGLGSYALQAYVGGVRPMAVGFKQALVQPQMGSLDWMKVKVPTPYGVIELEAEKNSKTGVVKGEVKCPAEVKVHASEGISVKKDKIC